MENFFPVLAILFFTFLCGGQAYIEKIECIYSERSFYGYSCQLLITNPNGWDNFTEVTGKHLDDKNNDDVQSIIFHKAAYTTNVPTIICEVFENIQIIDFSKNHIRRIDENSFIGCTKVQRLYLDNNVIDEIAGNALIKNTILVDVRMQANNLRHLPRHLFASTSTLQYLNFARNSLMTIYSDTFGDQPALHTINLEINNIDALDEGIIGRTSVSNLYFSFNICGTGTLNDPSPNRTTIRMHLARCFENFRIREEFAQRVTCDYIELSDDGYTCEFMISNVYDWNNFTEIEGEHLAERGDEDVKTIRVHYRAVAKVIPLIVCATFENLENIFFGDSSLETIDENSFSGCKKLTHLFLDRNNIREIPVNAFHENEALFQIEMHSNLLTELPKNLFAHNPMLRGAGFENNFLSTIHFDTFANSPDLLLLFLSHNRISALDERIIEKTAIIGMTFENNLCADSTIFDPTPGRNLFRAILNVCFRNYQDLEGPPDSTTNNDYPTTTDYSTNTEHITETELITTSDDSINTEDTPKV